MAQRSLEIAKGIVSQSVSRPHAGALASATPHASSGGDKPLDKHLFSGNAFSRNASSRDLPSLAGAHIGGLLQRKCKALREWLRTIIAPISTIVTPPWE